MSLIPAERSDLNQSVICAVCKCHGHMHAVCEVIVEFGPSMTLGTGAYSIGIIITNAYLTPATLLEITCSQKFKDNPHAPGIFAYLQVSHQASRNWLRELRDMLYVALKFLRDRNNCTRISVVYGLLLGQYLLCFTKNGFLRQIRVKKNI